MTVTSEMYQDTTMTSNKNSTSIFLISHVLTRILNTLHDDIPFLQSADIICTHIISIMQT